MAEADLLPQERWDSPKRTQWDQTARGLLERTEVSPSVFDSFREITAVGSQTTDEQLRQQKNAVLKQRLAVLESVVEQLSWNLTSAQPTLIRSTAKPGFLDSIIIILVSAALVLFLLWVTSRTLGLSAFENVPGWLAESYKSIWTSVASGAAGIGLAIVKALQRKKDEAHPNYLLLIGLTTVGMLALIFVLPTLFTRGAKPAEPTGNGVGANNSVVVSGTVVEWPSNDPVKRAQISLVKRPETAVSDDNGNFVLKIVGADNAPADVRLKVTRDGYTPYESQITVPGSPLLIQLHHIH